MSYPLVILNLLLSLQYISAPHIPELSLQQSLTPLSPILSYLPHNVAVDQQQQHQSGNTVPAVVLVPISPYSIVGDEGGGGGAGGTSSTVGWKCTCYTIPESFGARAETECRCAGAGLRRLPVDLDSGVQRITITDAGMVVLRRDALQPYRTTLHEVILSNLHNLTEIESGAFRDIPNLRTIYITHTPIMFLPGLFDGVTSTKFLSLRIIQTGLLEMPDLSALPSENIVHMIDLENNLIEHIPANAIKIRADQVTLNFNQIKYIDNYAFNGSEIAILNLRGNHNLKKLAHRAFDGLKSLLQLDVSDTAIDSLPIIGLEDMEILKIENTPSMTVIPSIYDFVHLKEAYLTHPFHCCAFKYPEQHDPNAHRMYEERLRKSGCTLDTAAGTSHMPIVTYDTGQQPPQEPEDVTTRKREMIASRGKRSRAVVQDSWGDTSEWSSGYGYDSKLGASPWSSLSSSDTNNDEYLPSQWQQSYPPTNSTDYSHLGPLRGQTIELNVASPGNVQRKEVEGTFFNGSTNISQNTQIHALCGNLTIRISLTKCYPEPNALNPCEDIMGSCYLRISVWFVVILAVLGNVAVIVVVVFSGGELTVPRFLMCNLACADLCMGLYLLLIASMDYHSVGTYFNFAFDWQYGTGCQLAGFLTVFASQLSIFTLTVLTVERWFAITYAIYLTKRIRISVAAKIMICGYIYAILMATLPLVGISNYSSTSICLPMEVNHLADRAYLLALILIDGLAFVLIVVCYAQIYLSLAYETRHASHKGEMTIAKKMALLVFTDFVCWAPIAFFSLTALAGYPLIGVTRSKILLVFFYPLNSCANPYLYAIMTAQYRKDFFVLLSKCGICTKQSKNFTIDTSLPTNSHPIPLLTRINGENGRKSSTIPTNVLDDAFV